MVKRTLIAIAVLALIAGSIQAAIPDIAPDPHTGTFGGKYQGIKVNIKNIDVGWPFEYVALDLCVIPIYMHVGYYVHVKECNKRKIKLVQVDCAEIDKGSGDWPCYFDCDNLEIKSNFEVKLGLKLINKGSVIDKWSAYVKDSDVISAGSNTVTVCVKAWKAKLYNADAPGTQIKVGDLVVTVKPNV